MVEKMGSRKRFSVVIPLYNKDSHIVSTLNSVVEQTFTDFEIIIVDDGSTDTSLQQARSVSDQRIKIVEQGNQGVSVARNRGVQEAEGDYIAFLDADDHWYPWHLEELNCLIDSYPGRGVYSVAHEIWRGGKKYHPAQFCSLGFTGVVEEFFEAFSKSLALVNSTTACLPRDLLIRMGGFPEGIKKGEDVYIWIKASIEKSLVYSDRVCARYNQDAQCRSNRNYSGEVPYYLLWLDEVIFSGALEEAHEKGAFKFLQSGIFYNAAGYRLDGNKGAFKNIKKLRASRYLKLRLLLLALELAPRRLLMFAQRHRHTQA
ncbi:glycosyltransferase family 2 protein [Pseudomonas sp. SA3-5]|uniref:Glycosyltransferase family 2 protein n=1 Tax=Pseudomonas aestuarii TaxID=3018340 RepID=A0ABT4XJW3_9PSED|nr:glycosyltransferase family 2 protein [Pseudomonas aestuarii]MDA7088506.1 glycosyltransferase family 2 protein [Pseudomonas aestuarii]